MERKIFILAAIFTGLMLIWALMVPSQSVPRLPDSPPPSAWFQAEVLDAPETVLIDFSAMWCGPCKFMAPMVEQLEEEYTGRLKLVTIDIDEEQELASYFRIDGVPYLYVFRDGKPVDACRGMIPTYEELVAFVKPHLPESVVSTPEDEVPPAAEAKSASQ